jgi:2-polyprenyl-6-methoxyphenol hydroxylase-like FAD-dependent oxidoreductase
VRVFDRRPRQSTLSRAIALQPRTLEILERLGLIQEFSRPGLRFDNVSAVTGPGNTVTLSHRELPSSHPYIMIIPQDMTEDILLQRLDHLGVTVERSKECRDVVQNDDYATATIVDDNGHTEFVSCSWLLGCDGIRSSVRKCVGLELVKTPFSYHLQRLAPSLMVLSSLGDEAVL